MLGVEAVGRASQSEGAMAWRHAPQLGFAMFCLGRFFVIALCPMGESPSGQNICFFTCVFRAP